MNRGQGELFLLHKKRCRQWEQCLTCGDGRFRGRGHTALLLKFGGKTFRLPPSSHPPFTSSHPISDVKGGGWGGGGSSQTSLVYEELVASILPYPPPPQADVQNVPPPILQT